MQRTLINYKNPKEANMMLKQTSLNLILSFITAMRKAYWHTFKPVTFGVKIIAVREGRILLIKNRYHDHWYLPGGSLKKGEDPCEAVRRELREECALEVDSLAIVGQLFQLSRR